MVLLNLEYCINKVLILLRNKRGPQIICRPRFIFRGKFYKLNAVIVFVFRVEK
ncbi:hypothetical protein DFQ07_1757 [Tenacibaculum caenipelagi]|uniref:Uncharacterized protein n=1 Tax=Tenacibaculum caenipelagi TaxID=1325435 RepID=A0A4R6TGH3_9FLAO|nr:hypothetical protein DFQ07_1757 [Tenacibaculum caenipelagi]